MNRTRAHLTGCAREAVPLGELGQLGYEAGDAVGTPEPGVVFWPGVTSAVNSGVAVGVTTGVTTGVTVGVTTGVGTTTGKPQAVRPTQSDKVSNEAAITRFIFFIPS